jgi:hypothetical protein
MPDITLLLANSLEGKTKEELSTVFDQEVERFSQYMSNMGDWRSAGPLSKFERALIKTYLIQKFSGKIDGGA